MITNANTLQTLQVRNCLGIIVAVFLMLLGIRATQAANFAHPGVEFDLADLQRMQANLNVDPWKSGFNAFANQSTASSNYVMQGPFTSVTRNNTGVNTNRAQFDSDMAAAYNLALMWNATGDANYAAKSRSILIAWFTTLTNWNTFDGVVGLEVSLAGYTGAPAAEILRYTYPGWTSNDTFVCATFFTNKVWNWIQANGYGTGNQGAAKVQAMVAVAVFCDNPSWFSVATNVFMTDTCNSLSRNSLPTGQNAEAGRDQGHPLGAIGSHLMIADMCWKATGGGANFYSYLTNRILLEMEYYATYNMGGTVPYQAFGPCNNSWNSISATGRGGEHARYQLLHVMAGYVNRLGLSAPASTAYLGWFPVDGNDFRYDNSTVPATPAAPQNLKVIVGDGLASLTWNPTLGATSYKVYRATTSGGPFTLVGTTGSPHASDTDTGLVNGTSYYYAVAAVGAGGEGVKSSAVFGSSQVLSLADADVGTVGMAGSATYSAGTWTVQGAGGDIGGGSDNGNFAYQTMTGDGEIIVRLASATWISSKGKIGVMMRGTLAANSAEVSLLFDRGASSTPRMFYRDVNGSTVTYNSSALSSGSLPIWFRLKRAGNSFTGYTSQDGVNWNYLSTAIVVMPSTVNVGMFVCSRAATLATGNFNNVSMTFIPPSPPAAPTDLTAALAAFNEIGMFWTASSGATSYNLYRATTSGGPYTQIASGVTSINYSDTTAASGTTYYYVVTAVNGGGQSGYSSPMSHVTWIDQNIGSTGSGSYSGGVWTIMGSGSDIGGTGDSFNFASETITGDGTLIARLSSATWIGTMGKIGLMMRETTNSNSKVVAMLFDRANNSARMAVRSATGGTMSWPAGAAATLPQWYRIQRVGNVFTTYTSANGASWTPLGTNTVSMSSTIKIGLAVCSRNSSQATGVFSNVTAP